MRNIISTLIFIIRLNLIPINQVYSSFSLQSKGLVIFALTVAIYHNYYNAIYIHFDGSGMGVYTGWYSQLASYPLLDIFIGVIILKLFKIEAAPINKIILILILFFFFKFNHTIIIKLIILEKYINIRK